MPDLLIGGLLLAFGVLWMLKPDALDIIDRYQKSLGTTRPSEVETSDRYYLFVRILGFGLAVIGLALVGRWLG